MLKLIGAIVICISLLTMGLILFLAEKKSYKELKKEMEEKSV